VAVSTTWWDGAEYGPDTAGRLGERDGRHLADGEVISVDVVVTVSGVCDQANPPPPPPQGCAWPISGARNAARDIGRTEHLRAGSDTAVVALGDAAAWWSRRYGSAAELQAIGTTRTRAPRSGSRRDRERL